MLYYTIFFAHNQLFFAFSKPVVANSPFYTKDRYAIHIVLFILYISQFFPFLFPEITFITPCSILIFIVYNLRFLLHFFHLFSYSRSQLPPFAFICLFKAYTFAGFNSISFIFFPAPKMQRRLHPTSGHRRRFHTVIRA